MIEALPQKKISNIQKISKTQRTNLTSYTTQHTTAEYAFCARAHKTRTKTDHVLGHLIPIHFKRLKINNNAIYCLTTVELCEININTIYLKIKT